YLIFFLFFFFFSSRRRHTRSYGDWSSDVCSSDLCFCSPASMSGDRGQSLPARLFPDGGVAEGKISSGPGEPKRKPLPIRRAARRSEERRVGKECRARRSTDHEIKKNKSKKLTASK